MYRIAYYCDSEFNQDTQEINLFFIESMGNPVTTDYKGKTRQYTPIRMVSGTVFFVIGDGAEIRRRTRIQ